MTYRIEVVRKKVRRYLSENKLTIRNLFDRIDVDGSAELNLAELKQLVQDLGVKMKDIDVQALMEKLDTDGSGECDIFEFAEWLKQYNDDQHV